MNLMIPFRNAFVGREPGSSVPVAPLGVGNAPSRFIRTDIATLRVYS